MQVLVNLVVMDARLTQQGGLQAILAIEASDLLTDFIRMNNPTTMAYPSLTCLPAIINTVGRQILAVMAQNWLPNILRISIELGRYFAVRFKFACGCRPCRRDERNSLENNATVKGRQL